MSHAVSSPIAQNVLMDETVGRVVIEAVEERLRRFPQVKTERDDGNLLIMGSPNGFDIEVRDDGREATIDTGIWHDHTSNPAYVANLVTSLLSPQAKIVAKLRRSTAVRSDLFLRDRDGNWHFRSRWGLLFPGFGKKTIETYSNTVLSADEVPSNLEMSA